MSEGLIYKDEAIQVLENRLAAHDVVISTLNFGSNTLRSQRRHEVAECIEEIRAIPLAALGEPESVVSPDHVLKVELGEFTNYTLVCNLDDAASCHQTCATHPEGGCGDFDTEDECVTKVYEHGCTVAEWVNDGGIEAVEFSHTLELPVKIEWRASHDYPSLHVPPASLDDRVKKLEWRFVGSYWVADAPLGLRHDQAWYIEPFGTGDEVMLQPPTTIICPSIDAAKALASKLQALLSSPTSVGGEQ